MSHFDHSATELRDQSATGGGVVATGRRRPVGPWLALVGLITIGLMAAAAAWAIGFGPFDGLPSTGDDQTRVVVSPFVNVQARLARGDDVVFTVEADEPAYWRMATLDRYEDNVWKIAGRFEAHGPRTAEEAGLGGDRTINRQEFQLATMREIWLPAAAEPVELAVIGTDPITVDHDANTIAVGQEVPTADGFEYAIRSSIARPTPAQLRAAPPSDGDPNGPMAGRPETPIDIELANLAETLTIGLTTDYDRAIAIQDHLRGNFDHEALPVGTGGSAADVGPAAFLQRGRGSAQDFATAFALMGRAVGLPTRVAVGFTWGEPIERESGPIDAAFTIFEVRNRHVHTWPEVHFDGIGWVAFEPTPGRGIPGAEIYTGVPAAQTTTAGG